MPSQPPSSLSVRPEETLDALSRTLVILQRRKGHRAASDDVLLAWAAARACPEARHVLDLGTGKGTVALLLLRRLPHCRITGVEALPMSHDLALRNAQINELAHRYLPILGDCRDQSLLAGEPPFDLICGAPPFIPLGSGTLPGDPQRAAGRFEMRGGVREYAEAAARHVSPKGRVVLLMDGKGRDRGLEAVVASGLRPLRIIAITPHPGGAPTYWIFEASPCPSPSSALPLEESFSLRLRPGGEWTAEYNVVRWEMDLPGAVSSEQ